MLRMLKNLAVTLALLLAASVHAQSPYNDVAGRSAPTVAAEREVLRPDGTKALKVVQVAPQRDTDDNQALTPLIHGSAGNVVAAIYDKDNKRAIMDGGFTRLFYKWESAGTARYIKNAAAWLANHERFGDRNTKKTASK